MISSENRANAKLTRFSGIFLENEDTNSIKINRLGYNMSFWLLTVHVQGGDMKLSVNFKPA